MGNDFDKRNIVLYNSKGEEIFRQDNVEIPSSWSNMAAGIFVSKYFYGKLNAPERETSIYQVIDRVVDTIIRWGYEDNYFNDTNEREIFKQEFRELFINQKASHNSPVWFGVGAYDKVQTSACFILSIEDNFESIRKFWDTESKIFNGGSGSGINISPLRSKRESLSGGGKSSGPVSFMRAADSLASVIKSAGRVRRAAKLVVMDLNHPDITDFIECKIFAEKQLRALQEAGLTTGMDDDFLAVPFQSSNHSINITDEFMNKVLNDEEWCTFYVNSKVDKIADTYRAKDLFRKITSAIHDVADPGILFTDTINQWNTVAASGRINSPNPCLRKGSRILTKKGWQKIEELEDKEVELFDGIGFSLGKVWKSGNKKIIRLHTNNGRTIDLTEDHKIYTESGWVEAKYTKGLHIPYLLPHFNGRSLKVPKIIKGADGKNYSYASSDMMESLGFFFGDGNINGSSGVVNIYYTESKDREFIDSVVLPFFCNIAANVGEVDYVPGINESSSAYCFSRNKLTNWLYQMGFKSVTLPERTLPDFIWNLSQDLQFSFLKGLFGANGNVLKDSNKAIVLVSSCKKMLQEVQLILQNMGIVSSVWVHNKEQEIKWNNGTYVSRESYHLRISHRHDIFMFDRLIGFPQTEQNDKVLEILLSDNGHSDSPYRFKMKIVKIEDLDLNDDVYDFSSPLMNSGLVDGILVHNCGEHLHLDNTACNLAVLKLTAFYDCNSRTFDIEGFKRAVDIMITAQDILIDRSEFPTEEIKENSIKFRPLGLGYSDLGGLLMRMGYSYDSHEGRNVAASIASLMTAQAYHRSAELAVLKGRFSEYDKNYVHMWKILDRHKEYNSKIEYDNFGITKEASNVWHRICNFSHGFRNSQVTLMAPNGTTGIALDCDTLGIEPEFSLVKYKTMAGKGYMKMINEGITDSLIGLGYAPEQVGKIKEYAIEKGTMEGSLLEEAHLPVFDCAIASDNGRCLTPEAHIKMLAAIQPHISSGISKTVNLPNSTTVEEIEKYVIMAWQMGIKGLTFYRDGCKVYQPLSTKKEEIENKEFCPVRKKLPVDCASRRHKFRVGDADGYLHTGMYEDGTLGEIFITISKEGSALAGLFDTIATLVSISLQYGVSLEALVQKFSYVKFEPAGFTNNDDIKIATSIVDYIFRYLGKNYLVNCDLDPINVIQVLDKIKEGSKNSSGEEVKISSKLCPQCGGFMIRTGSCYTCDCGFNTGCG